MRDGERSTAFLQQEGWHVRRVWNNEVYDNLEGALEGLLIELRDLEELR